jgi:hypothetical protein
VSAKLFHGSKKNAQNYSSWVVHQLQSAGRYEQDAMRYSYADNRCPCISGTPTEPSALFATGIFFGHDTANSRKSGELRTNPQKIIAFDGRFLKFKNAGVP